MRYTIDLITRYESALGFLSGTAIGQLEGAINKGIFSADIAYNEAKWQLSNESRKNSQYEAEIYLPNDWSFAEMTLSNGDQSMDFSFGSLTGNTEGVFAPPPLLRFNRTKSITVTTVDNGNETDVVENFGINSWEIEMEGMMVDMDNHVYPGSKLKELVSFFEINDIIDVVCPLFLDLGIKSIYFKEQKFEPVEAFPDTIRYSLSARSIKPALFTLIQK